MSVAHWSPHDDGYFASSGDDGRVVLWHTQQGTPVTAPGDKDGADGDVGHVSSASGDNFAVRTRRRMCEGTT